MIDMAAPLIPKLAVTKTEAAKMLSISITTLWRLVQTNQIRATRYGRIPVRELYRHLDRQTR